MNNKVKEIKEELDEALKPKELDKKTKKSLKQRIITGIILVCVAFPFVFLGDWFFFAFVFVVALLSFYEIYRVSKPCSLKSVYVVSLLFGLIITFAPFVSSFVNSIVNHSFSNHAFNYFPTLNLPFSLCVLALFFFFFMVLLHTHFTVKDAIFLFTMMIIVALSLQSVLYLRFIPSLLMRELDSSQFAGLSFINVTDSLRTSLLLVFIIVATFLTDGGAYFVGIFFGRHKINPRISPNKTVEGFIGGIVISFLLSSGIAFLLSYLGLDLLPGVFDFAHWYNIVIVCFIIPFIATLGDFVFSSVKRFFDVKDYSNLLPGHGGILDRFDSLYFSCLSVAIYVAIFVNIAYPGYNFLNVINYFI